MNERLQPGRCFADQPVDRGDVAPARFGQFLDVLFRRARRLRLAFHPIPPEPRRASRQARGLPDDHLSAAILPSANVREGQPELLTLSADLALVSRSLSE
jgi:hypothetical protein